jgi:hypothetical protein
VDCSGIWLPSDCCQHGIDFVKALTRYIIVIIIIIIVVVVVNDFKLVNKGEQ